MAKFIEIGIKLIKSKTNLIKTYLINGNQLWILN